VPSPRAKRAVLDQIAVPRLGPGRARAGPDRALGDKAYGSRANRAYLRKRGIKCTIPEQTDRVQHRKHRGRDGGRPPAFDREIYKQCISIWAWPAAFQQLFWPRSTARPMARSGGPGNRGR
jgi:hypothetical protein